MSPKIDFQVLATTLMGSVTDTFRTMCQEQFSKNPVIETRPIDWEEKPFMNGSVFRRIHVSGYISFIHYYHSPGDKAKHKPCGVLVVFVKESGIMSLLPALGFTMKDYSNQDLVKDMIGELCNNIAGGLKSELHPIGYQNLEISTPSNYKDFVPGGIKIPKNQKECHQMDLFLWDSNPVAIDVILET